MSARRWKKTCRARCAQTGRTCELLEGHRQAHAAGKWQFTQLAQPGQTHFPLAEAIARAANARTGVDLG